MHSSCQMRECHLLSSVPVIPTRKCIGILDPISNRIKWISVDALVLSDEFPPSKFIYMGSSVIYSRDFSCWCYFIVMVTFKTKNGESFYGSDHTAPKAASGHQTKGLLKTKSLCCGEPAHSEMEQTDFQGTWPSSEVFATAQHRDSRWRVGCANQASQMSVLPLHGQAEGDPETPHPLPHGWAAVPLWDVWEALHSAGAPPEPCFKCASIQQADYLQRLQENLHKQSVSRTTTLWLVWQLHLCDYHAWGLDAH